MRNVNPEALLALELFHLNPRSKKGLLQMQQHLIEVAMYFNPEVKSGHEIVDACSKMLVQTYSLSESECNDALREGCQSGRILKKDDYYSLSEVVCKELDKRQKEFSEAENAFNKGLSENVGKALKTVINPFGEAFLCDSVRGIIQEVFYSSAVKLRSLLSSKSDVILMLDQDSQFDSKLAEKIKTFLAIQNGATLDKVREGVNVFLANLNPLQSRYVGNLHRRVFYFQILNVDPRLQDIQKTSFKNTKIYLDTNVAINYVCDGTKLHQTVFDILRASIAFEVKLFVSPITLKEAQKLVNEAINFSPYLKDNRITKVMQASNIAMSNPVIEGFRKQRERQPNLNWEAYVSPMRKLEEYFLSYDILVEEDLSIDIDKDDKYQKVLTELNLIKPERSENIRIHDASNLVLIQRLRKKYPGTPLGNAVWLITLDNKLPVLDRHIQRDYPSPHCRMVQQWGEVLVNFENVGKFIASDDYIAYLASQKLGAYIQEETLDIHIFDSLANSEVLCDKVLNLEPEIASNVIQDLQKDREMGTLLEQLKQASTDEKDRLVDGLDAKVESFKDGYLEKVRLHADEEIVRLETGIKELRQELHELQSQIEKDNERIGAVTNKLKVTEEELDAFRKMPFWDRFKRLFRQ